MKKILLTSLIVTLGSLAAAQEATPATPAPETTMPADATMTEVAPEDSFAKAQELAAQAEIAYPVPFYDRTLYKAAIDEAVTAMRADNNNREYSAYVAELFTKTQWWINAYNGWSALTDLTDQEKQWASLSATKLAYLALQYGDTAKAKEYIAKGMEWMDSPTLQALMRRAG